MITAPTIDFEPFIYPKLSFMFCKCVYFWLEMFLFAYSNITLNTKLWYIVHVVIHTPAGKRWICTSAPGVQWWVQSIFISFWWYQNPKFWLPAQCVSAGTVKIKKTNKQKKVKVPVCKILDFSEPFPTHQVSKFPGRQILMLWVGGSGRPPTQSISIWEVETQLASIW